MLHVCFTLLVLTGVVFMGQFYPSLLVGGSGIFGLCGTQRLSRKSPPHVRNPAPEHTRTQKINTHQGQLHRVFHGRPTDVGVLSSKFVCRVTLAVSSLWTGVLHCYQFKPPTWLSLRGNGGMPRRVKQCKVNANERSWTLLKLYCFSRLKLHRFLYKYLFYIAVYTGFFFYILVGRQ